MNGDFLLVHKSILPACLPDVVRAKDLIAKDSLSVTEACKACDISRSVFYKYKDYVFLPTGSASKKAIISLKADDFPGVLSSILAAVSKRGANVLTISQDMPIHGLAYITMMVNTKNMEGSLDDLVKELLGLSHVRKAEILAYE
jgi:chorismate mutase